MVVMRLRTRASASEGQTSCLALTCAAFATLIAACDEDPSVQYIVGIDWQPGIVVTVDGVALDPFETLITPEYPDFDTAITAPLFRIETWREGSSVEAIDIGFGACAWFCAQLDDYCIGEDTVVETVGIHYDDTGQFQGYALDPRNWRGRGCVFCTFRGDAELFVFCT